MAKPETVSTSQMIASVASKFDELPKKITKQVINHFLNTLETEVASGKKLRIDKIGILQVKDRAPRIGRNPQTGEEIKIPASKKIAFRASKSLKDQVVAPLKKKGLQGKKK
ncbi:MAG: HU family DNA-binding protein [Silvanigrellaceae bacterium]|nr:HU family DNA-binding protein [Silvanigrellaceae bacterium]